MEVLEQYLQHPIVSYLRWILQLSSVEYHREQHFIYLTIATNTAKILALKINTFSVVGSSFYLQIKNFC